MLRFLCTLPLLLNLLQSVKCQQTAVADCTSDFLKYHACIVDFNQKMMQAIARKDDEREMSKCFQSNDCDQPSFSDPHFNVDKSRMKQCYKEAQDKARLVVQDCMVDVKLFKGFSIPKDNAWQDEPLEDPRLSSHSNFEARKQINKLCLTPESRIGVRSCLNDLQKNISSFARIKQKCDEDKRCMHIMTEACQSKLDEIKPTVCECASQTLANLKVDFETNFRSCYGRPTEDDSKLIGYLIKNICDMEEMCVESVDPSSKPANN